jgi:hypothetical protein
MNAVSAIDKKITGYLTELNTMQKKAVLSVVKAFAVEEKDDFEKEMDKRFSEIESGAVKGYTLEEASTRSRKTYKASKSKKNELFIPVESISGKRIV